MAKRKRLTPANPAYLTGPVSPEGVRAPETKMMHPGGMRAPIADVASDAAATAAMEEMGQTLARARAEGRMVLSLPLEQIDQDYLVRDRMPAADPGADAEMDALVASLRDRGQQMPIEVVALGGDRYGLISGWRRCQALSRLARDAGGDATVLALLRRPDDASDAYLAMVEENEVRVGLSHFERARIAAKAVAQGVFKDEKQALLSLFRTASRAKRSKIRSFLSVVHHLDGVLRFPAGISERMGLQLAQLLDAEAEAGPRLRAALHDAAPRSEAEEMAVIAAAIRPAVKEEKPALTKGNPPQSPAQGVPTGFVDRPLRAGVVARLHEDGRVELRGTPLSTDLRDEMLGWLSRSL